MSEGLWISEAEVVSLMALPQAIDALRDGLREEAAGRASNMVKTHASWANGSTLHAIGAVFDGWGTVGTKTWAHTAGGAMPLLILIDSENGSVQAIIEAFALGQMRTGGISGLGTDVMARPDASRMTMIGTGKQSITQVAAVAAVRPLTRVTVWSPTAVNREALAEKIEAKLGVEAIATQTLDEALDSADIVTLATRARSPFLSADALPRGVHVNAVGAITPERAEFDAALIERASVMAADSVPQVRKLSREFMDAFGEDEARWQRLQSLSTLVAGNARRPADADLTLFKAMGMGISDLSLGIALLKAAREAGAGRPLPAITRQAPRLTL
ncbi:MULTISPECIES: ornithine cyclodeaminase family protein [Novosphingobium]|jgi:ornithine cyclodeaminase|uniref:Ornithine cyclodeaminase family protein n=1 Tax=Novosphingobium album (ex Liu et al. 2023) TaxID=3031130 RepID=A0ABT5WU75_9SPHN|nr:MULTISPECIES: ornithine cyclodeaminase family protein [Novosphingobium]EZP67601.1 Ornithine cyclodeaminase [Sphingomonas paucimobilis]MDE8653426.1 ornithine cyclodeaminase family protein [Novosphingobium album (ex Liu et al. 2023)]